MPKALYQRLKLPQKSKRPFFYANFVQSVDGVVQSRKRPRAYWPLGSERDFATLIELRAKADVLIHGRKTAELSPTLRRLREPAFAKRRKALGKTRPLFYLIVTTQPQKVLRLIKNPPSWVQVMTLAPDKHIEISRYVAMSSSAKNHDKNPVALSSLSRFLHRQGHRHILVEGGPHLVTQFIKAKLLDELFLTITPKLLGNEEGDSLHLMEDAMFPPKGVPKLKLISQKMVNSELFLRYRLHYPR